MFLGPVRNWLRIILLGLTILRWLPDISKNCGPLPSGIFLQALCTSHPPTSDQSAEYRSNAVFPSHLLPSVLCFELSSSAFFSVCSFLTVKDQIQESHKTTCNYISVSPVRKNTQNAIVTSIEHYAPRRCKKQRLWQATKMNLYRPITKKRTKMQLFDIERRGNVQYLAFFTVRRVKSVDASIANVTPQRPTHVLLGLVVAH
jgi:hypothetical protein